MLNKLRNLLKPKNVKRETAEALIKIVEETETPDKNVFAEEFVHGAYNMRMRIIEELRRRINKDF